VKLGFITQKLCSSMSITLATFNLSIVSAVSHLNQKRIYPSKQLKPTPL